eukprot:9890626-Lingulodinium_polyedra.AAC.1
MASTVEERSAPPPRRIASTVEERKATGMADPTRHILVSHASEKPQSPATRVQPLEESGSARGARTPNGGAVESGVCCPALSVCHVGVAASLPASVASIPVISHACYARRWSEQ